MGLPPRATGDRERGEHAGDQHRHADRKGDRVGVLRGLAGAHVVSADIVEVAPAYDHAEITGIAAAHVAYELLSVMAAHTH